MSNVNFCSSQAPLVPTELFRSLVNAIQFIISLIRRIVISYNYFLPEFGVTKCMFNYMKDNYPDLTIFDYPGQIASDIFEAIGRMIGEEKQRQNDLKDALIYENNSEDEDIPNSTVDTYYNEEDNEIYGARSLESPRYMGDSGSLVKETSNIRWQMCGKIYGLESVVRYFIINYILE